MEIAGFVLRKQIIVYSSHSSPPRLLPQFMKILLLSPLPVNGL